MKFIATTYAGLESILAKEVEGIGATRIKTINRAVLFHGSRYTLYAANLYLRSAIRVLVPLAEKRVRNEVDLYQFVKNYPWEKHFTTAHTFAVFSVVSSPIFRHSHYVALKTKDGIVDRFRDKFKRRPDVSRENPDYFINIHIRQDRATLSLDSSGDSLHYRGYRKLTVEAPMAESLAAGLLLSMQWNKKVPFYDPMCGSGTNLVEAYLYSRGLPVQKIKRDFAFKKWRDFEDHLMQKVLNDFGKQIPSEKPLIIGSDLDEKAAEAAQFNTKQWAEDGMQITTADFFQHNNQHKQGVMMINPPYDIRLQEEDIFSFYEELGAKLKSDYKGWKIGIISAHIPALKTMGMRWTKSLDVMNGPHPAKFAIFDIYAD